MNGVRLTDWVVDGSAGGLMRFECCSDVRCAGSERFCCALYQLLCCTVVLGLYSASF